MNKSFEELSSNTYMDNQHTHMPQLCNKLQLKHPICSGNFPGHGIPTPPPLSPIPEPGTFGMLALGLIGVAMVRLWRAR